MHVGAEKAIQRHVARAFVRLAGHGHGFGQHELTAQAKARAGGCGLPSMVGLHGTERDDRVRAVVLGLRQQELGLTQLVATDAEPVDVVAFDQDPRAADGLGQPRAFIQRSGPVAECDTGLAGQVDRHRHTFARMSSAND